MVLACGYRPDIYKRMATGLIQNMALRSLSVGFDITPYGPASFSLRCRNEHLNQYARGIDYLEIFRVIDKLRANLSAQLRAADSHCRMLCSNPDAASQQWFPQLPTHTGDFSALIRLDNFFTTYNRMAPPGMPGVVAIGDAFQSANPANGMGLSKTFSGVALLSNMSLPRWPDSDRCDLVNLQEYYSCGKKLRQDNKARMLWQSFQLNAKQRKRYTTVQQVKQYLDLRNHMVDRIKRKMGFV